MLIYVLLEFPITLMQLPMHWWWFFVYSLRYNSFFFFLACFQSVHLFFFCARSRFLFLRPFLLFDSPPQRTVNTQRFFPPLLTRPGCPLPENGFCHSVLDGSFRNLSNGESLSLFSSKSFPCAGGVIVPSSFPATIYKLCDSKSEC